MRTKLIAACTVLVLTVSLCLFSLHEIERTTADLRALAEASEAHMERGDRQQALRALEAALTLLSERRELLEILTLHEAINHTHEHLAVAKVRLENGQKEEYNSAIALLYQSLVILYEQQRLSWSNLF